MNTRASISNAAFFDISLLLYVLNLSFPVILPRVFPIFLPLEGGG
jgi:hypothetical protein